MHLVFRLNLQYPLQQQMLLSYFITIEQKIMSIITALIVLLMENDNKFCRWISVWFCYGIDTVCKLTVYSFQRFGLKLSSMAINVEYLLLSSYHWMT